MGPIASEKEQEKEYVGWMSIDIKILFIVISSILMVCDIKEKIVPNLIVLPAIALGIYLTGNWQWSLVMVTLSAMFFGYERECPSCGYVETFKHKLSIWRGGDVKLFGMVGAFVGSYSMWIFLLSYLILVSYRGLTNKFFEPLPYAPFIFMASLPFLVI